MIRIALKAVICLLVNHVSLAQIQIHNDEFNDAESLPNWHNINQVEGWNIEQLEAYNIGDSVAGQLFMLPHTVSWYNDWRGAYLFKYLSGDFVITTEVTATGRDGVSLPSSNFSLAGIMVREPINYPTQDPANEWVAGQQNYIFMSIGQATGAGYDFEIKNTCSSHSCLDIVGIGSVNTAKIRMARVGQKIIVLSQFGNDPWVVRNRYDRTGMQCNSQGNMCSAPFSDSVQIGFVTYTDWDKVFAVGDTFHNTHVLHPDSIAGLDPAPGVPFNPDLRGAFNYARFDSVTVPQGLAGLDLADPSEVSDAEILSFLGYTTEEYCPEQYHVTTALVAPYTRLKANNLISLDDTISEEAQVIMQAPQSIELLPGATVTLGSQLQLVVLGCDE